MNHNTCWILDVDLRKFFDTLDHRCMRDLLSVRVRDGLVQRLVAKWLKAGVLEAGNITYPQSGTPQGGVISPLLSNIYLHEVLDKWFVEQVKPRLDGYGYMVRFADDFVMGFDNERDARRVLETLHKRFAKYGLKIHPDKTRLVRFERPNDKGPKPETFNFLGFTHYWGRTRRGGYAVKRKTMSTRLTRSLKKIYEWCSEHRHDPLREQYAALCVKVRGHYNYYGIIGNYRSLSSFKHEVERIWHKWLNRRDRGRSLEWDRFRKLLETVIPLPVPKIRHVRYAANPYS
jgi:group II intron reverse transcriptase/maturase